MADNLVLTRIAENTHMSFESQYLRSTLASPVKAAFLNPPNSIGEGYFQHQRVALGFAGSLALTALAALVHAVLPCLCETTAKTRISALNDQLQKRIPETSSQPGGH